jgi:alpha-methylacyl-CoA racemase
MSGALAGLKVIEMAGLGPCPLAGQLLADHGAEVISIDRKSGKANPTDVNRRGKRSLALNLKSADGIAILNKLIARADILIEGFRPGVMEKLGVGPEDCQAINPGLIYGRMTGWGQDGPLAMTAGHDLNYLAITGALGAMGRNGEPPMPPLNLVADYGGGSMFLLFGVLMALYERGQSGKGQVVDAAMVDGVPAMMGLLHSMLAQGLWSSERERNMLDGAAPYYRCYETSDKQYISVGAIEPQFFAELMRLADLPEDHCQSQNDRGLWPDRSDEYATLFKTRTRDEWMTVFEGSDACVAPVLNWTEVEVHPHNAARGTFVRVGDVMQAAPAPRLSRTTGIDPKPPGRTGQDSNELLELLGYGSDDLARLRKTGVLT